MQVVPLSPVPAQTLAVVLGGQSVQLSLYTLTTTLGQSLYADVASNGATIATARLCLNCGPSGTRLLRDAQYQGFVGDFCFVDTQGSSDPQYSGLGSRYQFVYLAPADLPP